MGSLESGSRQRNHLPSLNLSFKDGSGHPSRSISIAPVAGAPPTPLISPKSSMYPGQSFPYPYTPLTSAGSSQTEYFASLDSHRVMEEREKQQCHVQQQQQQQQQQQRQSLPSIHEALGREKPLHPYSATPTSGTPSQPTQPAGASTTATTTATATATAHPLHHATPSAPTNLYSNASSSAGPILRESSISQAAQLQADASRSSLASASSQGSRNASINSPTQSARTGITSIAGSQASSGFDLGARASGSSAASGGYGSFSQSFSLQPQQQQQQPQFAASYDGRPFVSSGPWKSTAAATADQPRVGEAKGDFTGHPGIASLPPHTESATKRHLEMYDVEMPLNEISDASARTLDFSQHYAVKAHQTQRSGPVLGSLPSLNEIEDMLHLQRRNQEALLRLRTAAVNQEHALAEQQQIAQNKINNNTNPGGPEEGHIMMYPEDFKGSGGFAGPDPKKRRGKAAPPGRCHSCNREETPEWRRGPDGARTLCNACGLHYAKLTRKMGADKASFLVSNLRPKGDFDVSSPRSS